LFRDAVRGATPLKRAPRALHKAPAPPPPPLPLPLPVRTRLDGHAAPAESAFGLARDAAIESGEEAEFLRDGIGRDVLRKLRRSHWGVQDYVDLHGLNRVEAHAALAEFVDRCARRGFCCVRIVHGKGHGSPRGEPVLKAMVRGWLALRDDVRAFCEAPANQGGSGALLVLLEAP
jgi:DNA-nicking Smr family endonuclease